MLSESAGQGGSPPVAILLLPSSSIFKRMTLYDFLLLFIYDAAEMVRPLTSYSTKIATASQLSSSNTQKEAL
jgi:hypothetical protein